MPRRMKYSPHLVTISEATTWSKGREVPTEMADHSIDVVIKPTHAALVEVTTLDHLQSMTVHKCDHPHPAKDVPIESLVEVVAEETRKPSTSIKDGRLVLSKTRNKYGRSILHHAVRKGDKKAIKKIIKTMPRLLYQVDSRGNHPLHYAANASVSDSFAIVYMLVKAGASLNALNNRLQSPLLIAVISNEDDDDKVSRILLYHKADPAINVTENSTLAQYASSRGLHKIAAALHMYM